MGILEKPTEKEARYDRGMRLWGADGQKALEDAHVCLCGATAAGTEALKNLVLPGIGRITVVDGGVVDEGDLGRNFFVSHEALGQPRAKVVAELLLEMNPANVKAETIDANPEQLFADRPAFLRDENVHCVIACGLPDSAIQTISEQCTTHNVHLCVLETNGLIGLLTLQAGGVHTVIEGYPDAEVPDLRVVNPFPELKSYFDSVDVEALTDSHEHSHVPWVVFAHKATLRWQAQQKGVAFEPQTAARSVECEAISVVPTEYKQRKQIKEVLQGMRLPKEVAKEDEVNISEALEHLNTFLPQAVPGALKELFTHPLCEHPSSDSDVFWHLLAALKAFVERFGVLPHCGTIPDMTSTTERYTTLRNVYRGEALRNRDWVKAHAVQTMRREGHEGSVSDDLAMKFCRNARSLRVITHPRIHGEEQLQAHLQAVVKQVHEGNPDAAWVALHIASKAFFEETRRMPGTGDDLQKDVADVARIAKRMLSSEDIIPDDWVAEWVRGGYTEIHTTAAVLGGVASQEVIKLVTSQRVPVNNIVVWNGIVGSTAVLTI